MIFERDPFSAQKRGLRQKASIAAVPFFIKSCKCGSGKTICKPVCKHPCRILQDASDACHNQPRDGAHHQRPHHAMFRDRKLQHPFFSIPCPAVFSSPDLMTYLLRKDAVQHDKVTDADKSHDAGNSGSQTSGLCHE